MRVLALIGMILGWLLYSGMSAWADCPMCGDLTQVVSAEPPGMHDHMDGMAMAGMDDPADSAKHPCSTTDMSHTPTCAACLILPVTVFIDTSRKPALGYPQPAPSETLQDNRPVPQAPPPRSI